MKKYFWIISAIFTFIPSVVFAGNALPSTVVTNEAITVTCTGFQDRFAVVMLSPVQQLVFDGLCSESPVSFSQPGYYRFCMYYSLDLPGYDVNTCWQIPFNTDVSDVTIEAGVPTFPSSPPQFLPFGLPFTESGVTFTHYILTIADNNPNIWELRYHNKDNLYVNESWFLKSSDNEDWDTKVCNLDTTIQPLTWTCANVQMASVSGFYGYFASWTSTNEVCLGTSFADRTVFIQSASPFDPPNSSGILNNGQVCQDLWPNGDAQFPDVLVQRMNIDANGNVTGIVDPAPLVTFTPPTGDYNELPNPLTDPTGFVSGFLNNLGVWIYNLFIPPSGYFQDRFNALKLLFDTKFAFVEQVQQAFVIPAASAFTPISLGSLSFGGTQVSPITYISSFDPATFSSFRTFFSMILYVGLGMFLLRKMSNIFSS